MTGAEQNPDAGLILSIKSVKGGAADLSVGQAISLFVSNGRAAAPFIAAGPFEAVWEGAINAELRSEFSFQAELNGQLTLEITGAKIYEANASAAPLSKPIQLNKGANSLRAVFTSPAKGDAFLRLGWTEKGTNTSPIPLTVLTHSNSPALTKSLLLHQGRELFIEYRCINCHIQSYAAAIPELKMDAPTFEGIGARRNAEWMARWILDPKATRASVHMPKLLNGPTAPDDAKAIAAFLGSLKTGGEVSIPEPNIKSLPSNLAGKESEPDEQKNLFEKLNCAACHNPLDGQADPTKISLKHVAQKFAPGKLTEFLRAPEAHFPWIRMPNFHLTSKEAAELADFLISKADKPETSPHVADSASLDRGKKLVQETGCLNCHNAKLANKSSAPKLADLHAEKWTQGCLASAGESGSKAPDFGFSAEERLALQAFGQTDRSSLGRHVGYEFAQRETRLLNCTACHGQVEGFPPLEILGGKLKPEWAARFIGGEVPYKPRAEKHPMGQPWLEMRMPAFKSRAALLAEGLAAQHGFPPRTPAEPAIDMDLTKIGQKLVGKEGGFSCISCHGVGNQEAMEVFEAEGVNFIRVAERLLPQYYRRWMRNPLAIDPQTKMPAYFEEGKSPLTDVLDGDAEKQITAIWQYLRLGDKMPPPSAQ